MLKPPPNMSFYPLPCSNQYLRPHPVPILEGTFLPLPLYCPSSKFPISRPLLHPLFLLSRRCSDVTMKEEPGCVCGRGSGRRQGAYFLPRSARSFRLYSTSPLPSTVSDSVRVQQQQLPPLRRTSFLGKAASRLLVLLVTECRGSRVPG